MDHIPEGISVRVFSNSDGGGLPSQATDQYKEVLLSSIRESRPNPASLDVILTGAGEDRKSSRHFPEVRLALGMALRPPVYGVGNRCPESGVRCPMAVPAVRYSLMLDSQ